MCDMGQMGCLSCMYICEYICDMGRMGYMSYICICEYSGTPSAYELYVLY